MSLFGLGKKKNKEANISCCEETCNTIKRDELAVSRIDGTSVKILGSGCAKCNQLEENVKAALKQLGIEYTIDHVTDFAQIAAYGVMTTPALVVNEKVISYGKVLKVEEAVQLLNR